MIQERHDVKLTNNQRKVLDYVIQKAENEHSLTVECPATEIQEVFKFGSRQTSYSIINALKDKGLITTLADEISLDPKLFVFRKDTTDSTNMNLRYVLQELEIERDVFPFLDEDKRKSYFLFVANDRELAKKISSELTADICKLADNGAYEFPLQELSDNLRYEIPHCLNVLRSYDFHEGIYEKRELYQAQDYLNSLSIDTILEYSNYNEANTRYLIEEYLDFE